MQLSNIQNFFHTYIYVCLIKNDRLSYGNQFLINFPYISRKIYLVIIYKNIDISCIENFLLTRFAWLYFYIYKRWITISKDKTETIYRVINYYMKYIQERTNINNNSEAIIRYWGRVTCRKIVEKKGEETRFGRRVFGRPTFWKTFTIVQSVKYATLKVWVCL